MRTRLQSWSAPPAFDGMLVRAIARCSEVEKGDPVTIGIKNRDDQIYRTIIVTGATAALFAQQILKEMGFEEEDFPVIGLEAVYRPGPGCDDLQ